MAPGKDLDMGGISRLACGFTPRHLAIAKARKMTLEMESGAAPASRISEPHRNTHKNRNNSR